ncbi:MAG: NIPSNAP family protein [Oscillospiraceae bacterium]|nr:NIPSNAP family protein [Oscillospiraceae bacterium]
MIYELRIYHLHPGRTAAILRRFEERMFILFGKHGIKVVDFYTDADGGDKIYYICEFESVGAKNAAWKSLFSDPELSEIARKYDEDGVILKDHESYLMERNEFFRR